MCIGKKRMFMLGRSIELVRMSVFLSMKITIGFYLTLGSILPMGLSFWLKRARLIRLGLLMRVASVNWLLWRYLRLSPQKMEQAKTTSNNSPQECKTSAAS